MSWFKFRSKRSATARIAELENKIEELERRRDEMIDNMSRERERLNSNLTEARGALADAERKAKHVDEDTRHLVKIKESQLQMAHDQKVLELERKKEAEIAAVKDTFRDKLEKQLLAETTRIEKMYSEILARLPNVNVKLSGNVGG